MPDDGLRPDHQLRRHDLLKDGPTPGRCARPDVADARYYSTAWSRGRNNERTGYYWYDCLHHVGFYLDKVMAMYAEDSETNYVGRSTLEDLRVADRFATDLLDQIHKLNNAIMGQDCRR